MYNELNGSIDGLHQRPLYADRVFNVTSSSPFA